MVLPFKVSSTFSRLTPPTCYLYFHLCTMVCYNKPVNQREEHRLWMRKQNLTNTAAVRGGATLERQENCDITLQKWKLKSVRVKAELQSSLSTSVQRNIKLSSSSLPQQHSRVSDKHWWVQLIIFNVSTTSFNTADRKLHSVHFMLTLVKLFTI